MALKSRARHHTSLRKRRQTVFTNSHSIFTITMDKHKYRKAAQIYSLSVKDRAFLQIYFRAGDVTNQRGYTRSLLHHPRQNQKHEPQKKKLLMVFVIRNLLQKKEKSLTSKMYASMSTGTNFYSSLLFELWQKRTTARLQNSDAQTGPL